MKRFEFQGYTGIVAWLYAAVCISIAFLLVVGVLCASAWVIAGTVLGLHQ